MAYNAKLLILIMLNYCHSAVKHYIFWRLVNSFVVELNSITYLFSRNIRVCRGVRHVSC